MLGQNNAAARDSNVLTFFYSSLLIQLVIENRIFCFLKLRGLPIILLYGRRSQPRHHVGVLHVDEKGDGAD